MPVSKHTKKFGSRNLWKKYSNKLKDFHRNYTKVTYIEDGKLVEEYRKNK